MPDILRAVEFAAKAIRDGAHVVAGTVSEMRSAWADYEDGDWLSCAGADDLEQSLCDREAEEEVAEPNRLFAEVCAAWASIPLGEDRRPDGLLQRARLTRILMDVSGAHDGYTVDMETWSCGGCGAALDTEHFRPNDAHRRHVAQRQSVALIEAHNPPK